jgi:hypothetical protein
VTTRRCFIVTAVFGLAVAGLASAEDRDGELFAIINANNSTTPSAAELEKIFLRKTLRWPDGEIVLAFNATPDSERRRMFDRAVLGMSPDEAARYWLDQRIRNGVVAPREVEDPTLAIKLVTRLTGAVAYVPANLDFAGVRIVARIRGGKVLAP